MQEKNCDSQNEVSEEREHDLKGNKELKTSVSESCPCGWCIFEIYIRGIDEDQYGLDLKDSKGNEDLICCLLQRQSEVSGLV